jgi:uncharacterized membrane protein
MSDPKLEPRFDLIVFPFEADTFIAISKASLLEHGHVGKIAELGAEEQALYHAMRASDIDMAHRPYSQPHTEAEVLIFGTFYTNLAAFKKDG